MVERRAHKRFKVAAEATLESDAGKFAALIGDLSRGGCFLPTFKEVEVGSTLRMVMELPGLGEIAAKATVRWRGTAPNGQVGLGISFDAMATGDRERLEAFCAANEA